MESELNASRKTVGLHTLVAVLIGYISTFFNNNWIAAAAGFAALFLIGFISEKLVAKKGIKFWFVNGVIIYLFVWLITWTLIINL